MSWLVVVLGYLLGSIPTAYIAGRLLGRGDIRQLGDGNMGANNAFRQLGAKVGVTVGIIDAAKGAVAILMAQATDVSLPVVLITGAAAVVGHNWPVFLGFRGGEGTSTTIGIMLALVTVPMLIVAGPAILTLVLTRNTTPAGAVIFIPLSFLCWWLHVPGIIISYGVALPCLVGLTHYFRMRRVAVRHV
jgi:glycerol-3-phosphate acyltransferase PlsY